MRTEYEIELLELRQRLKDTEQRLRNLQCIDLRKIRRLHKLRKVVQQELINHRTGSLIRLDLTKLMGGDNA